MRNKTEVPLKWGDFLIFFVIIVVACGIWIHLALLQTDQTYGEIWLDSKLYQQIKLGNHTKQTIQLKGKATDVTIEVDGKQMRFVESECADHTCENTGWVSRVGQTAVCLPNRVMIKITGNTNDTDAVDVIVQ